MNSQKTGQLIAAKRIQAGLTQKQLADQLHISDRTVSRWERGVGFPDLSLLEPLADALELSVLELLHGELLCSEQPPVPQAEQAARDTLKTVGHAVRQTARVSARAGCTGRAADSGRGGTSSALAQSQSILPPHNGAGIPVTGFGGLPLRSDYNGGLSADSANSGGLRSDAGAPCPL